MQSIFFDNVGALSLKGLKPLQKPCFVILSNKICWKYYLCSDVVWGFASTPCHTKSWFLMIVTQLHRSPGVPT